MNQYEKNLIEAINQLLVVDRRAREFGFEWPNVNIILQQIMSECKEVSQAIDDQESDLRIQEEIGDLLHTTLSLCSYLNYDLAKIMHNTQSKFAARVTALQEIMQSNNLLSLKGLDMTLKLEYWSQAKKVTDN